MLNRPDPSDLAEIELFVMDMDGTVYLGDEVFPWTLPFLRSVLISGRRYVFLTNNSSKGPKDYVEKLRRLGIPVEDGGVFTSGEATARFIKRRYPGSGVYLIGTPELRSVFLEEGVTLTDDDPDILVLGYDTTIDYEKIRKGALLLRRGVVYIATHPDVNCPSPEGLIPDAGSFIAMFRESTSRSPDHVIGKPNPEILIELAGKMGVPIDRVAVVGDRLYTDMALARNVGAVSILVLSGETKLEDLTESEVKPDFVVENLGEIRLF